VEIAAMVSYGTQSKGVAVVGISPKKEKEKSNLPIRLAKGEYLTENDDGILIGEGLANFLNVDVGDTVVFIGQGYRGASAAGLFPVKGVLRMPVIEMDNGLAYMTLSAAQSFIDMPDGYSGVLISIKRESLLNETMEAVKGELSEMYEVLPWTVTMEELMQTAASHKGMVRMIMMMLYLIVGFGILGTVIMMTNERKREFAMMISLGMSRQKLKGITLLELFILTLSGVILAMAVAIPLTIYLSYNPIQLTGDIAQAYVELGMDAVMGTVVKAEIFITQAFTILFFACLTFIYPIRKIGKLKISNTKNY
jgi:ABC-type lipoprotein release transport system permease subunit